MNRPAIHRAHIRACVIGALAMFSLAELAAAQQPTQNKRRPSGNRADRTFKRTAPARRWSEGRAIACLKANALALSPGCQSALTAAMQ